MSWTFGTFASRLAARLVSLDQGTAQDRSQRGQSANQSIAPFPKRSGGFSLHIYQTSYKTGLIV
jgi:hypothetical protein